MLDNSYSDLRCFEVSPEMIRYYRTVIMYAVYFVHRKLRTSIHGQILINLSAALMGLYIMFAIGGSAVSIPAMCGISSALLHYFILVFFGWTAVEAVWLYLKIVKVLGIQKYEESYILKAALPTWCKFVFNVAYNSTIVMYTLA